MEVLTERRNHWQELFERLADLLGDDAAALRDGPHRTGSVQPQRRSVVEYLVPVLAHAPAATKAACAQLAALQGALHWRHNPGYGDAEFLRRYAYCELLGPSGHCHRDDLALGLLLLAPATIYPSHLHPAREIYAVLSGTAQWRQGDGRWCERRAGQIIRHASMEPHAMRTDAEPLLAAYLWLDHLHEPARLVGRAEQGEPR